MISALWPTYQLYIASVIAVLQLERLPASAVPTKGGSIMFQEI
jgi:hypothetical protein